MVWQFVDLLGKSSSVLTRNSEARAGFGKTHVHDAGGRPSAARRLKDVVTKQSDVPAVGIVNSSTKS